MTRHRVFGALILAAALLGLTLAPPASAVIGGQASAYPFMASIQDRTGFAFCGGTVISSRWILTAAHCAVDTDPATIQVVTGRTDLTDTSTGQVLLVDLIKVHPNYADDFNSDAALLHLTSDTSAPAIALSGSADDDLEADGAPVTTAGWGDTLPTLGLFSSNEQRAVDLRVVGDDGCLAYVTDFSDPAQSICAEALLKDSCNGDSGGPLFATKSDRIVQIGIVSRGTLCAVPEQPGIYTEVNNTSIRSFIQSNAGV